MLCIFRIYRAKCSACLQQIIPPNQLVMRALDHIYHIHCFACVVCGHTLQKGEEYVVKHGQLFCRMDFEKEMALLPYSPKSKYNKSTLLRCYLSKYWKGRSLSTLQFSFQIVFQTQSCCIDTHDNSKQANSFYFNRRV